MHSRWYQIENSYYELIYRIENQEKLKDLNTNDNFNLIEFVNACSLIYDEFENSLNHHLNFANSLSSFFKFIDKLNNVFSYIIGNQEMYTFSIALLNKFMFIVGLKINPISQEEKNDIQKLVDARTTFRKNKDYKESDKIRDELLNKFKVELMDHKGFTVWKKTT